MDVREVEDSENICGVLSVFVKALPYTNRTLLPNKNSNSTLSLERVSNGEVEALRVLEVVEVVETTLVWHVYADAPVETQNKEVHVIAYAYTGTKSCLLKYVLQAKLRACAVAIIAQSPYVACIKEECTI